MSALRAERPASGSPAPWHFPTFERRTFGDGTLLAAHLPGRVTAAVSLVVDAGAVAEPAGREGVSLLTARLLGEGTQQRDAYAFAVAGERLGAAWQADTAWDSMRLGFDLPGGLLPEAVDLLVEAVRTPALRDEDFDRLRSERLDELRTELSQPSPRASDAFAAAIWAETSRYAHNDGGAVGAVSGLAADDVRAFHAERFAPGAATLVLAGDLDGVDVDALGRAMFEGWSATAPPRAAAGLAARDAGGRVLVVDRPGSVQSMLVIGHPGPRRGTPDQVAVTTMAVALGGVFNSRLNYKLREEKGYCYGASAAFDLRRDGGQFSARAAVHTEVTAPAAVDAVAEIRRMHDEGIGEEELDGVRRYRTGVFPIAFAAPHAIAGALGDIATFGLPDDYYDDVRRRMGEVSNDDVGTAARDRLAPDDLVTIVVGDAEAVVADLEQADLGSVTVSRD